MSFIEGERADLGNSRIGKAVGQLIARISFLTKKVDDPAILEKTNGMWQKEGIGLVSQIHNHVGSCWFCTNIFEFAEEKQREHSLKNGSNLVFYEELAFLTSYRHLGN